ncbi:MAG TPA: DNA primase [Candidatus Cloacimonas sp.]|jgi:DNA primase|nr:DNA primase [Candidatus Cloacimonas sp.]
MDKSQINEIISRNNIVDVISSYIPLKKSGNNYKARCPFHDEKTASFIVNESKQIFKCFGCGKGGNVVTFLMDYEKISFIEAMKRLAGQVGMSVQVSPTSKYKNSKRDLIYKIYQLANAHFQENLKNHGGLAQRYLQQRQLSQQTINEFQLGYALDSFGALRSYLLKNNINSKILGQTGLFGSGSNGFYDLFRQRLMFPIHSSSGNVIAFGGRVLDSEQPGGKYINSPTTDIYQKGTELYGLFKTKYEISKLDYALVSEGYMDFLRLHENGFHNAVASLGTALTDQQIKLLSRFSQKIYILYDGDMAGRKAAIKAAGNVLKQGYEAKLIILPPEHDPDSFLKVYGKEKLEELIARAPTLIEFLYKDKSMEMSRKEKLEFLIEVLKKVGDDLSKELLAKEIAETFGISQATITSKARTRKRNNFSQQQEKPENLYSEERLLLKLLISEPQNIKNVAQTLKSDYFLSEKYRKIYELLIDKMFEIDNINVLIGEMEDEQIRNTLTDILLEEMPNTSIAEVTSSLKIRQLKRELQQINLELQNGDMNENLLKRKAEIKKEIIKFGKKIVTRILY